MEKKDFKGLVLIFGIVLLLFSPVLATYFTGDDFFHFKVSQSDGSFFGFIKLFGFYSFEERGIAFYRPLFREVLFNLFYGWFGLDHLPFRILQFVLHFINTTLVFMFVKKVFENKVSALLASLFFAISGANVGSLYYLAGGVHSQAVLTFTLLAMLAFWLERKKTAFTLFILALMTNEQAVVIPVLLLGLMWLKEKKTSFKKFMLNVFKELWLYGICVLIFLCAVLKIIGISETEVEYKMNFNPKTLINTISWYLAWALGIPEMMVDFLGSGLKLNPDLMKNWGEYFKFIFSAFFGLCFALSISIYMKIRNTKILTDKKFIFLVVWFVVGLLPVLFLPIHKKTVYLQVSLPAMSILVAFLISKRKFLTVFAVFTFLVLNVTTILLAHKSYWAAQRGLVAKKLINDIKQAYPSLPNGSVVYIKNDPNYPYINKEWGGTSKQAYFILNGSDALELLYKNKDLKVYYEDIEPPTTDHLYEFTARIQ